MTTLRDLLNDTLHNVIDRYIEGQEEINTVEIDTIIEDEIEMLIVQINKRLIGE